jgi:hypothetical protein
VLITPFSRPFSQQSLPSYASENFSEINSQIRIRDISALMPSGQWIAILFLSAFDAVHHPFFRISYYYFILITIAFCQFVIAIACGAIFFCAVVY